MKELTKEKVKKRPPTAKELLEKIKSLGDIVVRPVEGDKFRIIFGYEKAKEMDRAGIEKIPVAIIDANDEEERFLHMIDVLQDKDVSPLERAMSIKRYLEITSMDYETFADGFDVTKNKVSQWLEVLLYPKILVEEMESRDLTLDHGRLLYRNIKDPIDLERWITRIKRKRMTAKELGRLLRRPKTKSKGNLRVS